MPTSSLVVTFGTQDKSEDFSLSLDKEKNTEVYGEENKSTFAPSESAYLKLIHSSEDEYQLFVSAGKVNKSASDVLYPMSENVIFAATRQGNLTYIPIQSVTWAWMGKSPGNPLFSRRSIRIEIPSGTPADEFIPVGVLQCEYNTNGDRLKLTVTSSDLVGFDTMDVLVVAIQGENKATTTISYDTGLGGEPVPINLLVKDFCSDEKVNDVDVYLDGVYVGETNGNGKIYLGMMVPNTIHQLKMTRSGYIDSDLDVLHNDSFTVPAPYTRRETIDNLEQELTDLKDQIADIEVKISNLQNEA